MSLGERAETEGPHLLLITEEPLKFQVQRWYRENMEPLMLIQIPHRSFACNPNSECKGIVFVSLERHTRGFKESLCRGCETRIPVDLTKLQIGLGIW